MIDPEVEDELRQDAHQRLPVASDGAGAQVELEPAHLIGRLGDALQLPAPPHPSAVPPAREGHAEGGLRGRVVPSDTPVRGVVLQLESLDQGQHGGPVGARCLLSAS